MNTKQQTIVGLKELRENVMDYIKQVKKGKSFTIVRRSQPVFNITPVEEEDSLWESVADFTKIKKGGVNIEEILSRI
ncbi:MAG: type II toxin-antitoxin system prevent-host-death family antitoxin [bacterium]